jgi:serine-type D-Ala-D-Ala carboxypeptidase/endopeptidase (penicillin-binding protein 4)
MKRGLIVLFIVIFKLPVFGQLSINNSLNEKITWLEQQEGMHQSTISLTVIDAVTGKNVFSHNGNIGLPMASTQKAIIAIASLENLKSDFVFHTQFNSTKISEDTLYLEINTNGDPSFGSYAFSNTDRLSILNGIVKSLPDMKGVKCVLYNINKNTMDNSMCKAWTWEDMGNYYGAPAQNFNWRENTIDILLSGSAEPHGKTIIEKTIPANTGLFINRSITDKIGSGDGTNIYRVPDGKQSVITGTIPALSKNFEIKASWQGIDIFIGEFSQYLIQNKLIQELPIFVESNTTRDVVEKNVYTYKSPPLDSLLNRYLRKSINLYGEAFLKTLGKQVYGFGSYQNGINVINNLSKKIGIDTHAVHIFDGSGLSPQNRITTAALCSYLFYAKSKPWFSQFHRALPIINNLSMKSGSIHQTRAYVGYSNPRNGRQYIFAIVAHNYDGSGKEIQNKLWKILDVLK